MQETLLTTKDIELVKKKKFAAEVFHPEYETYIVYIAYFSSTPLIVFLDSILLDIHPFWRPQISGLIAKKISTKILNDANFANIIFLDLASELPEHTKINNHAIKLVDGQQPPYVPIYSLRPVELKTLKAYIKTNLANGFIRLSKSPTGALILFDWKPDVFFCCTPIVETSTISQSRIGTCCHWLGSR